VLRINNLRENGLNLPAIRLPSSAEDARALQAAIATEDALRESEDAYTVEPEVEELHADRTARLAVLGGDDTEGPSPPPVPPTKQSHVTCGKWFAVAGSSRWMNVIDTTSTLHLKN